MQFLSVKLGFDSKQKLHQKKQRKYCGQIGKKNITKYIKHTIHLILQNFFITSSSLNDMPTVNREKTGKKKKVNSPKRRFVL